MSSCGKITSVAGTVIKAETVQPVANYEVARVGRERLLGRSDKDRW